MSLTTVQNMMIGVVLCMVFIVGGGLILTSFISNDTGIDTTNGVSGFNNTLNKAQDVQTSVQNIQDNIEGIDTASSQPLGIFNVLLSGSYDGVKAMFGSLSFISTALTDTSKILGVDIQPITILIGLVGVIIIGFAIWATIMRVGV